MDDPATDELRKETEPIDFPDWEIQLTALGLGDTELEAMRRSIVGLLARCKAQRVPVSIAFARQYLEEKGAGVIRIEALRWFVTAGRYQPRVSRATTAGPAGSALTAARRIDPAQPRPPMASDRGSAVWEQALIRALRRNGLSWRTEQTYRQWAWGLARWLEPHPLSELNETQIQDFLTALAAERGLSPASQKQALNAVAFLWREALGHAEGDFSGFVRARPKVRLPVVLTREECLRWTHSSGQEEGWI